MAKENLKCFTLLLLNKVKKNLNDKEVVSILKDSAIQRIISYAKKPSGAKNINLPL